MQRLLENKTILFIAPVFYGYEKIIVEEMKRAGAHVIFYPERENSLTYKFLNNFKPEQLVNFQKKYYSNILKQIKDTRIDYLVVIKGVLMPTDFTEKLKSNFPGVKTIMHQWDSIKNYNYEKYIDLFDKFFSFDPEDCRHHKKLNYLPNFYLSEYTDVRTIAPVYDISFIGWAYKDRLRVLKSISKQLPQKNIYQYCYISFSSFIKNISKGISLPNVKFKPLALKEVFKVVQHSFSILDIPDPNQAGYTYRAIDAMAAGKKLITSNVFIRDEKFYNEKNILIIDRNNPVINDDFFRTEFSKINIEEYSLANWIRKLFTT